MDDHAERSRPDLRSPASVPRGAPHVTREYRRALRDFTQLTRRRLANPLTAIAAGVTVLRELEDELDPEVRQELLRCLQRTAAGVEREVLHPELAGAGFGSGNGGGDGSGSGSIPGLDARQLADLLVADAVEAEQHARGINERLFSQVSATPEQPIEFLCECWALECDEHVRLPIVDYFIVHARHDQFVIAPGHDLEAVEHVMERHEGWWVVRKTADAMRTAMDERILGT